ncbi:hypothetical protein Q8F55_008371 [Vanrija albida]|uniref:MARVEL domain-containing protein n=1 Tax=Vanrija albida TaxID=181172 RepID=A0ABR3PW15_9TREE
MAEYNVNPARKITITTILAFLALVGVVLDGFAIAVSAYASTQAIYGIGLMLDLYMLGIGVVASWSTIAYSLRARYPLKGRVYGVLKWAALCGAMIRLVLANTSTALLLTVASILGIIFGLAYCPNFEATAGLTTHMGPMGAGGYAAAAPKPYDPHSYAVVGAQQPQQIQYAAPVQGYAPPVQGYAPQPPQQQQQYYQPYGR